MKIFRVYQMETDKIPCGFTTIEVRSIGHKYVWLRQYRSGAYGLKPKQFKKIDRQLWNSLAESKYFKEVTDEYKEVK
tara:strand:- start:1629 stop:1859 length:231 start_codon:yes stop_codon:yes gene_type:complete